MGSAVEHSLEKMKAEVQVDEGKWNQLAQDSTIHETVQALKQNHISAVVVDSSDAALEEIKKTIPQGASVMNGSSTTLAEIGFVDLLQSKQHAWNNLHASVFAVSDPAKQADARREATTADYFVSSAQAVTKDGKIVGCDASGSRVGAWLFAAKHLLIVAGTNKIVENQEAALKRIQEFAYPLENLRAQKVYNMGSRISKIAVLGFEFDPNRTKVILVKEKLGY
ncbi:lactate utilization protein [Candidatus Micrarchaeota archaeon]|nr:lactate utilization protein [Candidatus Micrarchaeota archaeon]